jgi:hypothetical protein
MVLVSGPGHAQDAQALFDEGLANMKAGHFKLGCALIKRSLDVDARPGTVFTLAECYSKAGKYASAVSFYDHFIAIYEAMPKDQQEPQQARADVSRTERTRLVAQVAWLTVIVPPLEPPGVVVTLDGEEFPASLFGIATAIDPGPHVFTTRVPDGPLIEQRVDIAPGERKSINLDVRNPNASEPSQPAAAQPSTPDTPDRQRSHPLVPWMWTSFGIGAAGLITGTVTGVMLLQERAKIMEECPTSGRQPDGTIPCKDGGYAAVARARDTLAPLTTVALSVGAAGVAAGVVLLILDANSGSSSRTAATLPLIGVEPHGATLGLVSQW